MLIEYDTQKLQETLQDFYNATGIDVDLVKPDFSSACCSVQNRCPYCAMVQSTPAGVRACSLSDRTLLKDCASTGQAQSRVCHAGLVDVAIPILYDQQIIGYLIFGRMRSTLQFSSLKTYVVGLGLDAQKAEKAYDEIPFFDAQRIRSVSNIATLICKYILLENMLRPNGADTVEKAVDYIQKNLYKELSVQSVSRGAGISKSVLYKVFHRQFHCTVSSYIKAARVEHSLKLLTDTDLSVEEISRKMGFSSASYYSKVFKTQIGVSPLQYRKKNR